MTYIWCPWFICVCDQIRMRLIDHDLSCVFFLSCTTVFFNHEWKRSTYFICNLCKFFFLFPSFWHSLSPALTELFSRTLFHLLSVGLFWSNQAVANLSSGGGVSAHGGRGWFSVELVVLWREWVLDFFFFFFFSGGHCFGFYWWSWMG